MNGQLVRVRADVMSTEGNSFSYQYPVTPGTPPDRVTAEIRADLIRNPKLDMASLQIFPYGFWTEPLDRDRPPIGNGPEGGEQPDQQRRIVPPQGGSGTAPQQRPQAAPQTQPGPLPQVSAQEGALNVAAAQLEGFLAQLRVQHNLTSAQFLAISLHALTGFAAKLAALERPQRRPS